VVAAPPGSDPAGRARYLTGALFLGPAFVLLGVWMVYPAVYTIIRSFFGRTGYLGTWVGGSNYVRLFTTHTLIRAIENNVIWVAVVPALVTAIGLIFAVLTERVSWAVAFKTAVFLPMAISAFATGVTWRILYQQDPDVGAINALGRSAASLVSAPGVLHTALPSTPTLQTRNGAVVLKAPLQPGRSVSLGLTGIPPQDVPSGAQQAVQPKAQSGAIDGVVWRDFKPGGGKPGVVEQGELGLPGVTVQVKDASGKTVNWAIEMNSPGVLARAGWSKRMFKFGDQITITVRPSKAGTPVGLINRQKPVIVNGKEVLKADGTANPID